MRGTDSTEDEDHNIIDTNIVRIFSKKYSGTVRKMIGRYYVILHSVLVLFIVYCVLFSSNLFHLLILFNFTALDALAVVICHDCPITALEQKYLNMSTLATQRKQWQTMGIQYKCNHQYEYQLESLTNLSTVIAIKMFCIIAHSIIRNNVCNK